VQVGRMTAPIKAILPSDAEAAPGSAVAIVALTQSIRCQNKVLSRSIQASYFSYNNSIS
jgi:hypothetical protein